MFLNNFRRVPDSCHREVGKSSHEFFKKSSCERGVFFGISGFRVGCWASSLSRVKRRSSRARGCKFGCPVITQAPHDRPYRNKHTQIFTPSLGTTALWPYSSGAVQIRVGLELVDQEPKETHKAKNFANSTNMFSEQFEGVTGYYPVNKSFEANHTRKFTRMLGKDFVTQFLCGTFSVQKFVLKLLHYSTLFFWTINFGRRNVKITSQKLFWSYFSGAVILTGDLNAFCTVISGGWCLWENFIWRCNVTSASPKLQTNEFVMISGQILTLRRFWKSTTLLKSLLAWNYYFQTF